MWLPLARTQTLLFLKRFLRKADRVFFFWRQSREAEVFLERHRADGLVAVSAKQRGLSVGFEKCLFCALCTHSCDAIRKGIAPPGFEPKQITGVFGKAVHETEVFMEEWYPCATCSACTVTCPNEVPIHAMVEQVLERRQRLGFRRGSQREVV